MHPGEVKAWTALPTIPGNQHPRLEGLAHNARHSAHLAEQQRELCVGHVVEDWSDRMTNMIRMVSDIDPNLPGVGAEDDPSVSGQHFYDEWHHTCRLLSVRSLRK